MKRSLSISLNQKRVQCLTCISVGVVSEFICLCFINKNSWKMQKIKDTRKRNSPINKDVLCLLKMFLASVTNSKEITIT